jgi:protein phosphatase
MPHLSYVCVTHIGYVRDHNEDNYLAAPETGLWIVADGMGGHLDGEVASAIVIEHVEKCVSEGIDLESAIATSHQAVLDAPLQGRGRAGMGTTVVGVVIREGHYQVAWVGDSRAYLWDRQGLKQLSCDHSYVQELVNTGEMTIEEAAMHPYRSLLTRCIGGNDNAPVEVDVVSGDFFHGQRILLCSDGLNGELSDEEIEAVLDGKLNNQETADHLVEDALAHGGSDNVTIIVITASKSRD